MQKLLNFHGISDEKIMKHFDLNVSNPRIILDQNNGKDFFTNQQPKFLYDFLIKNEFISIQILNEMIENYASENMSLENRNEVRKKKVDFYHHVCTYKREVRRFFP